MELIEPYYKFFVWIIVIAGLICALAPILISETRSTRTMRFIATIMCITSIVGGGFSLASGGLLGATLGAGLFGTLWVASLIVGVAAHFSDSMNIKTNEMAFRLLHNETEGLTRPKRVSVRDRTR